MWYGFTAWRWRHGSKGEKNTATASGNYNLFSNKKETDFHGSVKNEHLENLKDQRMKLRNDAIPEDIRSKWRIYGRYLKQKQFY